jgi:hypothetical protein
MNVFRISNPNNNQNGPVDITSETVFHLRAAFPSPNPLRINTIICTISLADASRGRVTEGRVGQVQPHSSITLNLLPCII